MIRLLRSILILCASLIASCNISAIGHLKIMTYNLRLGELATLHEIAEQIKAFNPDFVALQEVDIHTQRKLSPHQNGKDFISTLAYETGMFGLYGKTIDYHGGYEGIGMLSKYPYIDVKKLQLPNPDNKEPRVLLEGRFEIDNDTIVFAATHLDVNSISTRNLQAIFITERLQNLATRYPVILGGDLNSRDYSYTITNIMNKFWYNATDNDYTFPAWKPIIKIDYIYALPKDDWKMIRTQAVQSLLSDHLPIISELEYMKKETLNK
jgi:endonuclease/exonuclease/phosphatase family metal-dependent hydrolase